MRIINYDDRESQDIEPPLLEMAFSDDLLKALKGHKLLELVRHLQTQGPKPQVFGHCKFLNELWLKAVGKNE